MRVTLEYFRHSGKWYTDGTYTTYLKDLTDIWNEVREMQRNGTLPGLVAGFGRNFYVRVNVPEHPFAHPKLILPRDE